MAEAGDEGRVEVLSWLALTAKSADFVEEQAARGPTFEKIGTQWLAGAEAGRIARRRGRSQAYSETTLDGYRRSFFNYLVPEFGGQVADEIGEVQWQVWVDELAATGCPARESPRTSRWRRRSTRGRWRRHAGS